MRTAPCRWTAPTRHTKAPRSMRTNWPKNWKSRESGLARELHVTVTYARPHRGRPLLQCGRYLFSSPRRRYLLPIRRPFVQYEVEGGSPLRSLFLHDRCGNDEAYGRQQHSGDQSIDAKRGVQEVKQAQDGQGDAPSEGAPLCPPSYFGTGQTSSAYLLASSQRRFMSSLIGLPLNLRRSGETIRDHLRP